MVIVFEQLDIKIDVTTIERVRWLTTDIIYKINPQYQKKRAYEKMLRKIYKGGAMEEYRRKRREEKKVQRG